MRRFAALTIDAAAVVPVLFALVYGGNALGGWFGIMPFRAFWAPPPIVQTSVEPLGESDVPLDMAWCRIRSTAARSASPPMERSSFMAC